MKRCPKCGRQYGEQDINFCLDDGELLMRVMGYPARAADDSPPTVVMNEPRITNQSWPQTASPAPWQQHPVQQQNQQAFSPYGMSMSPSQTLAVVSLCLGIGSVTVGWCCSLGLLLSPGALVTGFIALSQIKKDPKLYGGRGMAIGGIVTSLLFLGFYLVFLMLYGVAILFGGMN